MNFVGVFLEGEAAAGVFQKETYKTLGNSYWSSLGLKSLQKRYEFLRYSSELNRRIRESYVRWREGTKVHRLFLLDSNIFQ